VANIQKVLIVDLDGSLIKSDMLFESFCSALSEDFKIIFRILKYFFLGRAQLKNFLYKNSNIDIKTLPYNEKVIKYIKNHKKEKGYTVLVTASNYKFAEKISNHLGLFNEVKGSSEINNLKSNNKKNYLITRFGHKQYDYIGNSKDDIPVWQSAKKAIICNTNKALIKKCALVNQNWEQITNNNSNYLIKNYFKALRPYQWIKNILVFLPILAAHELTFKNIGEGLIAFFSFSFIASCVYLINDLMDLKADRAHPRKKLRPFASCSIEILYGILTIPILFTSGILLSLNLNYSFTLLLIIYFLITTFYSLLLKRLAILDIFTLAILYTIRIVGGGIATDVSISFWLLAFSMFIFLSLAAIKRQAEIIDLIKRNEKKAIGRGYFIEDLPIINMISICSGFISVLVVCLYVNSPKVLILYDSPWILWCACWVLLYWIININFLTNRGEMNDDPIIFAIKNKTSLICMISFSLLFLLSANL